MSSVVNSVILAGSIATPPEIKSLASGLSFCKFELLIRSQRKGAAGEKIEEVDVIPVVTYGPVADICIANLKVGSNVFVHGKLKDNRWIIHGRPRSKIEVTAFSVYPLAETIPPNSARGK